jgi:tRNA (guanine37-N1)-methyltransferase
VSTLLGLFRGFWCLCQRTPAPCMATSRALLDASEHNSQDTLRAPREELERGASPGSVLRSAPLLPAPTSPPAVPLFAILTLFPEALEPYLSSSIVGIAREKGAAEVLLVDFRDFARDRHRTVDDRPFGGGPGMVLRPEPVVECVEWLEDRHGPFRKLMLCPSGTRYEQPHAHELAEEERVLLLCGRYEGFDERISQLLEFERFSVGDFVLAGGELPALTIVESVARLLPGVLGDERSAVEDSFQASGGLDHPHYTRPRVFRGLEVPDVLRSGDHERIASWRKEQAHARTLRDRPDLLEGDRA